MNTTISQSTADAASFRDPSGFVFRQDGVLYRQINLVYRENFDLLLFSGLYDELLKKELIVEHSEAPNALAQSEEAYKIIRPQFVSFWSYPYEWCFSQLKDAALTTLRIQRIAFEHGMVLKDASAYNIQFVDGKPLFIDTLSFEKYREGEPWIAYRQFCQHFLAPLALMAYRDVRLNQLLKIYVDGIPLDLASRLLPFRTHFKLGIATHIHLHAKSQKRYADKPVKKEKQKVGRLAFIGLMDHLQSSIKSLHWELPQTEWRDYYDATNYSTQAMEHKKKLVSELSARVKPESVWDLGANMGTFTRLAAQNATYAAAFDVDPAAVEINYLECKKNSEKKIVPLLLDLTNPSPAIGFENRERSSFLERAPADLVLALALIHHLAISNNVPLPRLAHFFAEIAKFLIIEFVPKNDSQVQRLLATREDIFPHYDRESFENCFGEVFSLMECVPVEASERTVYLMKRKD